MLDIFFHIIQTNDQNTYNEVHLEFECVGRDLRCGPDGLSDVTDGFCPSRVL